MKTFAFVYNLFSSKIFLGLRLLTLACLLFLCLIFLHVKLLNLFIFVILVEVIVEVFYRFKVAKVYPLISAQKANGSDDSFTLKALKDFINHNFLALLLKEESVKFILKKAEISLDQVAVEKIDKELLRKKALEVSLKTQGLFITTSDLIVAYLLLTEASNKLLFNNNLREEDLLNILRWTRFVFKNEEKPSISRVQFWGEGIAEGLVNGWLLETKKYTRNFSIIALGLKKIEITKRNEYEQMLEYLQNGASVILRGDPGVGKTSLVEQFARESYAKSLSEKLKHKKILEFMTDEFVSGVADQGELLKRFDNLIQEISHSGNVILLIENISNILGNRTYSVDLSQAIIPYIQNGQITIIATSTKEESDEFIKKRTELLNWFKIIDVSEPDFSLALEMLYQKTPEIEKKYNIVISYLCLKTALDLSKKYNPNSFWPKGAVSLLEDAASKASFNNKHNLNPNEIIEVVELKSNIPISLPKNKEKNVLLQLESEMKKSIIGQDMAVNAIAEAVRRIRSGVKNTNKPISFLFLGPTGVGKTETAKVLSRLYFGGEHKIIRIDMSEFSNPDSIDRFLDPSEGGFINKIFTNPFSLILLDEFEKASEKIQNLFLQVLDDGRITGTDGKTVSFSDCIIIATSNAGSEFIREHLIKHDSKSNVNLLNYLQEKAIFKPELLNRFDDVIVFAPLNEEQILAISRIALNEFINNIKQKEINLSSDDLVISKIAKDGFDKDFGARPIRRYIQEKIEDPLSKLIIEGQVARGSNLKLALNASGDIEIIPLT